MLRNIVEKQQYVCKPHAADVEEGIVSIEASMDSGREKMDGRF